jgi:hypothetical protein
MLKSYELSLVHINLSIEITELSLLLLLFVQLALIFIVAHAGPTHAIIPVCPLHLLAVQRLMVLKTIIGIWDVQPPPANSRIVKIILVLINTCILMVQLPFLK